MKIQNTKQFAARFTEMNLSQELMRSLSLMKITRPTDIQSRSIPEAMNGTDIIAIAQTGSGKTLAFALPVLTALEKNPQARALVLAPSREMAQQIYKVFLSLCEELAISNCLVIGGTPSAKQTNTLKKMPRLIVGTPGRLNDHLVTNKLLLKDVKYVVIDEADRMLDMGFAPQLKNIQNTMRGQRQTLMFSASFNPVVESIAQLFMTSNAIMIRAAQAEAPVSTLKQKVIFIDKFSKNDRLVDELNATQGGVIIFCGNQGNCERLSEYLLEYGFSVEMVHGGLSQGHRNRVVREFRQDKIRILVTTDLLARGMDIPHVDLVINFDLPYKAEDYLHRIGRTARAGKSGTAITFINSSDERTYLKIKPYLQGASEVKLDPNFAFTTKDNTNNINRYKNKKLDPKKSFDPTQKTTSRPMSKTIGSLNKPKKLSQGPNKKR